MILVPTRHENRFVFDADWATYLKILSALEGRRIRATFDGNRLELMTTSHLHERLKSLIGALLEQTMVELGVDFEQGGSMTFKRAAAKKGLEPDECYWLQHAEEVLPGWEEGCPPPDLVLEVEVSTSVLDRIGIYAALGVPELWRVLASGKILVLSLVGGQYQERRQSQVIPGFDPAHLEPYLALVGVRTSSAILKAYRDQRLVLPP